VVIKIIDLVRIIAIAGDAKKGNKGERSGNINSC
jgi:hypothetical protein